MFSISTKDLPDIYSHESAARYFAAHTKPKRSEWLENERPLSGPRMHHKRLVKNNDGSYSCVLYHTPLITYSPNGDIVVRMHDSVSSRKFIDALTPHGMYAWSCSGTTGLMVHTDTGRQWLLAERDTITLRRSTAHTWEVLRGAAVRRREFVDRQKSKEIRAELKPFEDWYRAADNVIPFVRRSYMHAHILKSLDELKNKDCWPQLATNIPSIQALREHAYDEFGAREVRVIPNWTTPKKGRRSCYS